MGNSPEAAIPSLDLMHNSEKVDFAFRTMQEIHARVGNRPEQPHRHDFYTVLWASKACGQHFIDYKEHIIRPNYIFFVNPGQVHQVITFGEPKGVVIMFTRDFLIKNMISEDFITNLGLFSDSADTPPIQIDDNSVIQLNDIANKIEATFGNNEAYKMDTIGAYLKLFLIECNKHSPSPLAINNQELQSGRIIIRAFKLLVEENFIKWHKVGDYAKKLNISSDYLNNVVKAAIGKTAKEYIQWRIILEAKRIGVHTYMSNKEIAFTIGFYDPSHFSKFYTKNQGESFSTFRKKLEKDFSS